MRRAALNVLTLLRRLRATRLVTLVVFAMHFPSLLISTSLLLLLTGGLLLRALAGTRVLLGGLTADGQATAMTHASVAADFHQDA